MLPPPPSLNPRNLPFYPEPDQVPSSLKSRSFWDWKGRKPICEPRGCYAVAEFRTGLLRVAHLYTEADTKPLTDPFAIAVREFANLFCGEAYKGDYIYRRRNESKVPIDGGGWLHAHSPLTLSLIRQHVKGKRIIGNIGFKRTRTLTFDVDFHEADDRREFFLARSKAIYEALLEVCPELGWSFFATYKPDEASGVHFTVVFPKSRPIRDARRLANVLLSELDKAHPELANIESFSSIEVYPRPKGTSDGVGCRLPLSKGRVTITDRILNSTQRENCRNLMTWLKDENRKNMDAHNFLRFLAMNTPDHFEHEKEERPVRARTTRSSGKRMGSIGPLRGRGLRTIFDFWSGKSVPANDTIGSYIAVTARYICKQGILTEEECLSWIEERCRNLPDKNFSDRLSGFNGGMSELMRAVRLDVKAIYQGNGYQADPEKSTAILEKVISYCNRRGIVIHEPSTWHKHQQAFVQHPEPDPDWQFSYKQRRILKEQVHPLLYAEETKTTFEAVKRIVWWIKQNPEREFSWRLVELLCGDLPVKWHRNKCCRLLRALVEAGLLRVVVQGRWISPNNTLNRATRYEWGEALENENPASRHPRPFHSVSIIGHSDRATTPFWNAIYAEKARLQRCLGPPRYALAG